MAVKNFTQISRVRCFLPYCQPLETFEVIQHTPIIPAGLTSAVQIQACSITGRGYRVLITWEKLSFYWKQQKNKIIGATVSI